MTQLALETPSYEGSKDEERLPEGWTSCRMGDIASVIGGGTPKASDPENFSENGHAWITPADLSEFRDIYITKGRRGLSDRGLNSCSAKLMPPGTVLMSSRAPIGYVAIAANDICTNQGFKSFICSPEISPEYVFHWLKYMQPTIERMGRGSTFTEISGSRCKEIPFDLPPYAEQKRIVAKIGELLARINAARDRLAKVPDILKRFRQSVLAAACSGQLTESWRSNNLDIESAQQLLQRAAGSKTTDMIFSNHGQTELPEIPEGWVWTCCQELCQKDRSLTYGVIKLGPPVDGGVPTLRSSDVRWLHVHDSRVKSISRNIAQNYFRTFLEGGEILVTVRGTLGGVAVAPQQMAGYNISREVAMVPIVRDLNARYICFAIANTHSQNWLFEVTKGVAYTGINIRDLKQLPLAVPPVSEQHEIVRRVDALFVLADRVEQRAKAAMGRVEKLTQSILARAFRGELVETEAEIARREGRTYETAAQLLERIRMEMENLPPSSPGSRTRRRAAARKKK